MKTTAIITGGSGGIGSAIAFELASNNIYAVLLAKNITKLERTAKSIFTEGRTGSYHQCDVTKRKQVEEVISAEKINLNHSNIILINCAGYGGPFQKTDEITEEEWDAVFNTNCKAAFLFCKSVLPLMKENKWGRIINISSVYGQVGGALSSAYAASKHALVGYTKSVAAEWGEHNITCNAISPGFIDTLMGAANDGNYYANVVNQIPVKRQGKPDEIAKLVFFLCSDESSYINGADIVIDGGLLAGRSFR